MKKFLLSMMCAVAALSASAASYTYTHTFAKGEVAQAGGEVELSGVKWTLSEATAINFDNAKGIQIGTAKNPTASYSLTTSAFSDVKITKVVMETSTASSGNATVAVTVGGNDFGTAQSLTNANAAYTFEGDASGELAVNYVNSAAKAIYFLSVTVTYEADAQIGEGGETPEPVEPDPIVTVGDGSKENPYTVADVVALNNTAKGPFWVTAYIVGYFNNNAPVFSAENAQASNLAVAAAADETDAANCLPVQLPTGSVRAALNLADNAGNLGRKVELYGTLEAYFSRPGIKSVTDYVLGEGSGEGGETPEPVEPTPGEGDGFVYTHTFASGEITTDGGEVELSGVKWTVPAADYIGFDTSNGKGLQLGSGGKPIETYTFTTSAFSAATITKIELEAAVAKSGDCTLTVKANGADFGSPVSLVMESTLYTFEGTATGGDLVFEFANKVAKAVYLKSIKIYYQAESEIGEGGNEGGEEPTPVEPVETVGDGSKEKPYTVADVVALNNPGTKAWVKGFIVGSSAGQNASDFTIATGESASKTNIFIAAEASETDYNNCMPIQLPSGALRNALNLNENPSNLGKEISLYGSLEKYFGMPGMKSTSEYVLEGGEEPTPVEPVETEGEGTQEKPYTVADVIALQNPGTSAWTEGYIVGYVNGMTFASDLVFAASDSIMSNIVIAPTATETDAAKCIPVQLPSGEIRSALNLKENPKNLGKKVSLYGQLAAYFGTTGIKSPSEYVLEGEVAPTYAEVDDIMEWIEEQPSENTTITGAVTVVYQNGLDLFIQDETGSLLVYGNLGDKTFSNGDVLTGITGKYATYNNMVQLSPVASTFENVTKGEEVAPAVSTLADVNASNLAKYVTISDLTCTAEVTDTKTIYSVTDGTNTVEIYNRYGIEGIQAAVDVKITGFVYVYGSKMEIVPVEFTGTDAITEITADGAADTVIYDLQGRRVTNAGTGLYIINGVKTLIRR